MRSRQTLSETDRRLVAGWAADCAERVLPLIEDDGRARAELARVRAFARGELPVAGEIRRRFAKVASVQAPAAVAAARALGQAAAVAHMGAHALGAAAYAARAAELAEPGARDEEIRWQLAQMSPAVPAALEQLPPVGEDRAGPLGPGLLAAGELGAIVRTLQRHTSVTVPGTVTKVSRPG